MPFLAAANTTAVFSPCFLGCLSASGTDVLLLCEHVGEEPVPALCAQRAAPRVPSPPPQLLGSTGTQIINSRAFPHRLEMLVSFVAFLVKV